MTSKHKKTHSCRPNPHFSFPSPYPINNYKFQHKCRNGPSCAWLKTNCCFFQHFNDERLISGDDGIVSGGDMVHDEMKKLVQHELLQFKDVLVACMMQNITHLFEACLKKQKMKQDEMLKKILSALDEKKSVSDSRTVQNFERTLKARIDKFECTIDKRLDAFEQIISDTEFKSAHVKFNEAATVLQKLAEEGKPKPLFDTQNIKIKIDDSSIIELKNELERIRPVMCDANDMKTKIDVLMNKVNNVDISLPKLFIKFDDMSAAHTETQDMVSGLGAKLTSDLSRNRHLISKLDKEKVDLCKDNKNATAKCNKLSYASKVIKDRTRCLDNPYFTKEQLANMY